MTLIFAEVSVAQVEFLEPFLSSNFTELPLYERL